MGGDGGWYKQGNQAPVAPCLFLLFASPRPHGPLRTTAGAATCRSWMTFRRFLNGILPRPIGSKSCSVLLACTRSPSTGWPTSLHRQRLPLLPRLISHLSRALTGIEIHPGAQVGRGLVIDHGMGVVIGETAIVGDHVLIYQGVTLGGTGKETGKRHPTVGHRVVIGAGAKVLGNITIGDGARIGAGSVVLTAVPANCTAVGVPNRIVERCNIADAPLNHGQLPDVEAITVRQLLDRITALEAQVSQLAAQRSLTPSTVARHE
jgi:serine O-acetyltransferase